MAKNIGKTAADHTRDADDVVTAIEVQGPVVAEAAAKILFEGSTPRKVSIEEMLALFGHALARQSVAYREADHEHTTETSGDAAVRAERDDATKALHERMGRTGNLVRGAFGPAAATAMGLDIAWASRPDLLLGQARNVVSLVRDADPGKAAAGVKIDLVALAKDIETDCDRLADGLASVVREERAAQGTFQKRALARAAWEKRYAGIAEVFAGLCLVAGHDELAARVKPPQRKNGKHDATPTPPVTPSTSG
ncbi:MAG TPA: hypothetical protein VL400_21850 [Polyangiaceae bacterium]|nr:hypothetical protein [Polyangiaceae bacterium]